MKQLDRELVERAARRATVSRAEPTRFAHALSRYLSAQGYAATPVTGGAAGPVPEPQARGQARRSSHHTPAVVVGVDGSPGSYVAVDHAAIEAQLRGWEVRLVHVQHPAFLRRIPSGQRDRGAGLLAEMGERIRVAVPDLAVATALRVGSAEEIMVAETSTAGLTVLGKRGYGTVAGMLTPSLSAHLASFAAGPVLVVRVPAWPPGQGWSERPVLVGVDDTAGGAAALAFGLAEAKLRGSHLVALHAARPGAPARNNPLATGLVADAGERLDGVRIRRRTVSGDPADALVEASAHAAAVVVGAHAQARLTARLLGSVGRSLIERAHCPVFVVPPGLDDAG